MSNLKSQSIPTNVSVHGAPKYTAGDLKLKRYIDLDTEIKRLTRDFETLRDEIKAQGTYSTQHFIALVEDRVRTNPPNLKTLIEVYGEDVRSLCTESQFKLVKVSPKGGD